MESRNENKIWQHAIGVTNTLNTLLKTGLFLSMGACVGYAYYHFIGCASGTCPITSNPYISTGYGAFVGLVLSWAKKEGKRK